MLKFASADQLLDICFERDASDIHIVPNEPATLRLHGRLVRLEEYGELSPADTERLFREVAPPRAIHELERVRTADFGYTHPKARFRVAAYYEKGSIAINFRLIPYRLRSFEEIGLPESVKRLLHLPRGLVLVTGPTGSGKTTTLATMIDYINENRETHIVTVEDPIEYFHSAKKSVISQREVGVDVPSFDEGVIRAMRMDPDVILVGEMRDLKTIQAAITAAETGHLVFATVHTTGAARTVERIVDVFPHEQQEQIRVQLSTNLVAIISQLLLPRADSTRARRRVRDYVCDSRHRAHDSRTQDSQHRVGDSNGAAARHDFAGQPLAVPVSAQAHHARGDVPRGAEPRRHCLASGRAAA
jgi:twitching motility protein PilT